MEIAGKRTDMSSKSPKLNRHQLETTVNILKEEVKRLHKEVLQVRTELKIQRARTLDLTYALQAREQELEQQQKDYDQEMKDIISKLLLLEADFRKEQAEIKRLLEARDATIESLTNEITTKNSQIESLRKKLESFKSQPEKEEKLKLEKKLHSQKLEIDNLRNANARLLDSLSHVRLNPNSNRQGKVRRSSTPTRTHGKNQLSKSELPEWKEELSAFF
ncbi:hypothetical protein ACROYT_G003532 [Oculina patagonica]